MSAALAIVSLGSVPAGATTILTIQSILASSPSSGNTFEVDLTNTGAPLVINTFSFELMMADTHFNFTSVTDGTLLNPYIFAGHSLFGPNLDFPPASGQMVTASDSYDTPSAGATIGTGLTVALGQVFIDVSAGLAAGPYSVSFISAGTSLSDPNGNPITIDSEIPGTITIGGAGVPEPSTLGLFGLGAVALAFIGKRLRI